MVRRSRIEPRRYRAFTRKDIDRIPQLRSLDPDQLLANPANFRVHPKAQQEALAGVLDQVGWVQNVLVNQRTGHVVDGHLRVGLAISRGEPSVPVLYVDLSPDEERLVGQEVPFGRMGTADDLTGMAIFLASPESDYVVAQTYNVDGGNWMS